MSDTKSRFNDFCHQITNTPNHFVVIRNFFLNSRIIESTPTSLLLPRSDREWKNSNLKTDNFAKSSMILNIENQNIKKVLYRRYKVSKFRFVKLGVLVT